jgi:iron-sulfur cluster assembly protein
LLDGLKVDYLLGLEASGFKIFNPNAKETCSCVKSFSA